MPRPRRRPSDSAGDAPKSRNRPRSGRTITDLSPFLLEPLGSMDDPGFQLLCERMIEILGPRGDLEKAMAGHVLWAFGAVRRGFRAVDLGVKGAEAYLRAMLRSFRSSQRTYDLARRIAEHSTATPPSSPPEAESQAPAPPPLAPAEDRPPSPAITPEPPAPFAEWADPDDEAEPVESAAGEWRTRIAMVPSIDARWPVVDRLGLVVDELLDLRDGGMPDDEIIERHPGLTYSDLAACTACEADGFRGPLEPPYPEDLFVIEDEEGHDPGVD
ncbi:DUF433 domain-containing protein [Tautonia plasticadhaerens]|uniref:DUF433 domain-containing protein n=1 Tax=Tautonia plasticadhaerens TaxID=2527974 RepID=A0A518GYG2_9BACT|nr:DUF433 domain-containing protein [Tautonia plasticadhaerens]QDV33583.1 hypothetical protein ElP_14570 [Tautonia plasticadhaerens]